ncbi:hypothetical protein FGG78_20425 [Thioclava sp. BHET1]|nr:hypothetical protein FGG78_20425 [Thioclava sp. BHET1]
MAERRKPTEVPIGIIWFREADYAAARNAMVDKTTLPPSYVTWKRAAVLAEGKLKSQGKSVLRVPLELTAFRLWCERHNLKTDANARSHYAKSVAFRYALRGLDPKDGADHPNE